jgi:hypothetical protein
MDLSSIEMDDRKCPTIVFFQDIETRYTVAVARDTGAVIGVAAGAGEVVNWGDCGNPIWLAVTQYQRRVHS